MLRLREQGAMARVQALREKYSTPKLARGGSIPRFVGGGNPWNDINNLPNGQNFKKTLPDDAQYKDLHCSLILNSITGNRHNTLHLPTDSISLLHDTYISSLTDENKQRFYNLLDMYKKHPFDPDYVDNSKERRIPTNVFNTQGIDFAFPMTNIGSLESDNNVMHNIKGASLPLAFAKNFNITDFVNLDPNLANKHMELTYLDVTRLLSEKTIPRNKWMSDYVSDNYSSEILSLKPYIGEEDFPSANMEIYKKYLQDNLRNDSINKGFISFYDRGLVKLASDVMYSTASKNTDWDLLTSYKYNNLIYDRKYPDSNHLVNTNYTDDIEGYSLKPTYGLLNHLRGVPVENHPSKRKRPIMDEKTISETIKFFDTYTRDYSDLINFDNLKGMVLHRGLIPESYPGDLMGEIQSGFINPDPAYQFMAGIPDISRKFVKKSDGDGVMLKHVVSDSIKNNIGFLGTGEFEFITGRNTGWEVMEDLGHNMFRVEPFKGSRGEWAFSKFAKNIPHRARGGFITPKMGPFRGMSRLAHNYGSTLFDTNMSPAANVFQAQQQYQAVNPDVPVFAYGGGIGSSSMFRNIHLAKGAESASNLINNNVVNSLQRSAEYEGIHGLLSSMVKSGASDASFRGLFYRKGLNADQWMDRVHEMRKSNASNFMTGYFANGGEFLSNQFAGKMDLTRPMHNYDWMCEEDRKIRYKRMLLPAHLPMRAIGGGISKFDGSMDLSSAGNPIAISRAEALLNTWNPTLARLNAAGLPNSPGGETVLPHEFNGKISSGVIGAFSPEAYAQGRADHIVVDAERMGIRGILNRGATKFLRGTAGVKRLMGFANGGSIPGFAWGGPSDRIRKRINRTGNTQYYGGNKYTDIGLGYNTPGRHPQFFKEWNDNTGRLEYGPTSQYRYDAEGMYSEGFQRIRKLDPRFANADSLYRGVLSNQKYNSIFTSDVNRILAKNPKMRDIQDMLRSDPHQFMMAGLGSAFGGIKGRMKQSGASQQELQEVDVVARALKELQNTLRGFVGQVAHLPESMARITPNMQREIDRLTDIERRAYQKRHDAFIKSAKHDYANDPNMRVEDDYTSRVAYNLDDYNKRMNDAGSGMRQGGAAWQNFAPLAMLRRVNRGRIGSGLSTFSQAFFNEGERDREVYHGSADFGVTTSIYNEDVVSGKVSRSEMADQFKKARSALAGKQGGIEKIS